MANPHMAHLAAVAWVNGGTLNGADLRQTDLCRADLSFADLRGANMRQTDLWRADLRSADLSGSDLSQSSLNEADLRGADLSGAKYGDDTINARIAAAERTDGYVFHLFRLEDGNHKILAGCRWLTIPEYRAHVSSKYPDTDKARETLDILDFFDRRIA